jgi:hypothetical protein
MTAATRTLGLAVVLAGLACTGGPPDADRTTLPPAPMPAPAPVPPPAPRPPSPEDGPPAEETAPPGGWIQDEVIYDAQGNVYGCQGGGNWCAGAPARDPHTHAVRR